MISKAVLLAVSKPTYRDRSDPLRGLPTALLPVANRPLVVHALDSFRATGVGEVAIVTEPEIRTEVQEAVCEAASLRPVWDFEVDFLEGPADVATDSPLAAVHDFVGEDPVALHLCDSVSRAGLAEVLAPAAIGGRDAVVATHDRLSRTNDTDVDLAAERLPGGPNGDLSATAPAGVYVFGQGILHSTPLPELTPTFELALIAMVRRLADAGGRVDPRRVGGWWRWDRRADTLVCGNRFALEGMSADFDTALLRDNEVQGGVVIDRTAGLESSTVRGPAIIGAGAWVRDAYIGPYTAISSGVVIEGGELENSIIFPEASLTHVGYRVEASIVGPGARLGRDFRPPKALRLMVGAGASISLG